MQRRKPWGNISKGGGSSGKRGWGVLDGSSREKKIRVLPSPPKFLAQFILPRSQEGKERRVASHAGKTRGENGDRTLQRTESLKSLSKKERRENPAFRGGDLGGKLSS